MNYGLTPQALDTVFPFHFIFDELLKITQAGSTMCRLHPTIIGLRLDDLFILKRPDSPLSFETLAAHCNSVILFESHTTGMRLKGQLLPMQEGEHLAFLGSPWITDISDIEPFALSLNDFALHDSVSDYLLLLQSKQVALQDTRRLAEKLRTKEQHLRKANQELQTEITERLRMEAALAEARDQALEASRLKSEFLATMSHEIRTPMNGIMGMSELLVESDLPDEQHEYAQVVFQEAETLLTLLNDILDFSKIEAGKLLLDHSSFSLRKLTDSVLRLLQPKAAQKGLHFAIYLDAGLPDEVVGDMTRIRQILVNLIGNAIKFTEIGEVVVELKRVRVPATNHFLGPGTMRETNAPMNGISHAQYLQNSSDVTLQISVRDSGIGISDQILPRLFTYFTQADGSTTRRYGGSGLGLAITKRLVELMNGTVQVESQLGVGSLFTVYITLSKAKAPNGVSQAGRENIKRKDTGLQELSTLHPFAI